jgi:hypothetical protein
MAYEARFPSVRGVAPQLQKAAWDQTLALVWQTLREFPEARLALEKALAGVVYAKEEVSDAGNGEDDAGGD